MNALDSSPWPMNVLFDPNATRLETVPEEAVNQAVEECKRMARKVALLNLSASDEKRYREEYLGEVIK